jgi:recombination protein RecR
MSRFAEPMSRLIDELRKLPGIGTKSAQRLAFHVLRASDADARALAEAILVLREKLRLCSICNNITDVDPCGYCASAVRDRHLVCVVEEPTNIATIEKTRSYNGVYHVLHGTLSPIGGVGPEQLRIANLLTRLAPRPQSVILSEAASAARPNFGPVILSEERSNESKDLRLDSPAAASDRFLPPDPAESLPAQQYEPEAIREVILATSPTTEGEATAAYLAQEIRRINPTLRVTRIATGVPAGSDIEYADEVTMTRALEGRREF